MNAAVGATNSALDWQRMPLTGRVLIEASAGTGKTFTIGLIYLRLLLERELRVEQILVATFTDAAAQELRERLRRRLVEAEHCLQRRCADAGDVDVQQVAPADADSLVAWLATIQLPDFNNFENRNIVNSTKIYDRTGKIVLYNIHDNVRRTAVDL